MKGLDGKKYTEEVKKASGFWERKAQVTLTIRKNLIEELKKQAKKQGISMSDLLGYLISVYLKYVNENTDDNGNENENENINKNKNKKQRIKQ